MRIGLYNLEPHIKNTAMMQVSTYHKKKGDKVEIYNHFNQYDKIYCFSIFDFTDKGYIKKGMICGGTGFDITSKLPPEIESCDYDYSLYPDCDTSFIWFSRGCIRACPFCIVNKKEGMITPVTQKQLNPNGKYISIMDNNFFSNPSWKQAIDQLIIWNQPVNFICGIDVRILNDEIIKALKSIKIKGYLHIAWDNPKEDLIPKIKALKEQFKGKIMCYVLIGYWSTPEEDMMRVEALRKIKIEPFIMPYNKREIYQRKFARWVNCYQLRSVKWDEYWYRKGGNKTPIENKPKSASEKAVVYGVDN